MRQTHVADEGPYLDDAGPTVGIVHRATREAPDALVFASTRGASHAAYAEATKTQGLQVRVKSHVRVLAFSGCDPQIVVPDSLNAGASKAHLHQPRTTQSNRGDDRSGCGRLVAEAQVEWVFCFAPTSALGRRREGDASSRDQASRFGP